MRKATLEQITKFMGKLESGEIDRPTLQAIVEGRFMITDGQPMVQPDLIHEGTYRTAPRQAEDRLPVPVDYSIRPDYSAFRKEFDWVSDGYKESKDWKRHESCAHIPTDGAGDIAFELIHLNQVVSTEQVHKELKRQGLRPATLEELICFARKYPDMQKEFPIVALGSSCLWRGDRHFPFLDWLGNGRDLNLAWDGRDWRGDCRFLAVRV